MSARRHHDFDTTDLNPDLLSFSFEVQTHWHAITGAPCSGKTTLIDQFTGSDAPRGNRQPDALHPIEELWLAGAR